MTAQPYQDFLNLQLSKAVALIIQKLIKKSQNLSVKLLRQLFLKQNATKNIKILPAAH